jgi:DNA-binding response OmpR family regulator
MRLLLIEDSDRLRSTLGRGLRKAGYAVDLAKDGREGLWLATENNYDLIVLDLMLPEIDGLTVLSTLRERGKGSHVLILSAKDRVEDRIEGLKRGADDYLVKPFSFSELSARVRALLRRGRTDRVLRMKLADLEMDLVTRRVTRAKAVIGLTTREFELLEHLLRHAGHVVTRDMLAADVWGVSVDSRSTPMDNLIDVQIARLRKKLDDPFERRLLHTVRGVGFVLAEHAP